MRIHLDEWRPRAFETFAGKFLRRVDAEFAASCVAVGSHSGSRLMRMANSSTTLKWPGQSSRDASTFETRSATAAAEGCEMRNRTTPCDAFAPRRKTSSPKSLSKVMSNRSSEAARASTSWSGLPGAVSRIHKTSCPPCRNRMTQSSGMFSLAQSRMAGVQPTTVKTFSSFRRSWA